jgi:ATP-binding cassette subfamily C protein CydCD
MEAARDIFSLLEQRAVSPKGGVASARDTSIRISDLEITYAGRRIPALDGAGLLVTPGETVAITGPSGCGKSTLLSVILGLRLPGAGSVTLGGVDLSDLDLDDWRRHIGWVPQRPHLFARSVAENVRLGRPDASDAAVADALNAAGLADVIHRLPHGAQTLLGEGGVGLSAGERQRVSLARAFVRDAPLLLLDEPTAGLDGETEADVLAAVRRLVIGRTAVIVAHRPALAALADRVVELTAPLQAAS